MERRRLPRSVKPALSWVKSHIADPVIRFYPTRQVYFRANGKVRFVSLSPLTQIAASLAVLGLLAWTGMATFNYVFMDDILKEKDQELAARQQAYDALSDDMSQLEVHLQGAVKSVQAKQRYLESLIDSDDTDDATAAANQPDAAHAKTSGDTDAMAEPDGPPPYAVGGPETPVEDAATSEQSDTPAPAPKAEKPAAWQAIKSWFKDLLASNDKAYVPHTDRLNVIASQIETMKAGQERLTGQLLARSDERIKRLSEAFKTAGLSADAVLGAMDKVPANVGGPLEALSDDDRSLLQDDTDKAFQALLAKQETLEDFDRILVSFPVVKPLKDYYYVSSTFGVRRDPFTNVRAMHAGLDMASHWKTPIYATAPGKIVKAGWHGAYGQMIEIDHGNGFKTRYGHLKTILVKIGQQVTKGERIGLMGNTGRSTGTHLHYEVRFLNKPHNPIKFFKAKQYVLKSDDS